jgi:hypothetical protein
MSNCLKFSVARGGDRAAGLERRQAPDIVAGRALWRATADDDFLDVGRVELGALHGVLDRMSCD